MFNKSGTSGTKTQGDAFSTLGRVVVRAPWVVIGGWLALVIVLSMVFTPLAKVVQDQQVQPLPPAAMAATNQMAKDFGESAQNVLVVVLTDKQDLRPADQDVYRKVASTLRSDTNQVASVHDFLTTPPLRAVDGQ